MSQAEVLAVEFQKDDNFRNIRLPFGPKPSQSLQAPNVFHTQNSSPILTCLWNHSLVMVNKPPYSLDFFKNKRRTNNKTFPRLLEIRFSPESTGLFIHQLPSEELGSTVKSLLASPCSSPQIFLYLLLKLFLLRNSTCLSQHCALWFLVLVLEVLETQITVLLPSSSSVPSCTTLTVKSTDLYLDSKFPDLMIHSIDISVC